MIFETAKPCERFDAPLARMFKDKTFAAGFWNADPRKPCCTLMTEIGMRPYGVEGVEVVITELTRTSGDTVTVCSGSGAGARKRRTGWLNPSPKLIVLPYSHLSRIHQRSGSGTFDFWGDWH